MAVARGIGGPLAESVAHVFARARHAAAQDTENGDVRDDDLMSAIDSPVPRMQRPRAAAAPRPPVARSAVRVTASPGGIASAHRAKAPMARSLLRDAWSRGAAWQDAPAHRRLTFVLKFVACALAGATAALLLWQGEQRGGEQPLPRSVEAPVTPAAPTDTEWPVREVKVVKVTVEKPQGVAGALAALATAPTTPAAVPMTKPPEIKSWLYQLQNIDPAAIARAPEDLAVIDYDGDGSALSKGEIGQMRRKPDGSRRFVFAYISIGEAETYRRYWEKSWRKRPPAWLGKENAKWRGNYAVRFWDPDWQAIVFARIDRIVAAGFDGLYLDKVDEFETLGHRDDMVEFVARIAARAKSARNDLMIVSQNGDDLLQEPKFRRAIDGFAREDLFYGEGSDGVRNTAGSIRESLRRLKLVAAEGKPVLVVEYPRDDEQATAVRREIADANFIGLTAKRALDR